MSHPIPGHDYSEPTLEGEPDLDDDERLEDHHDPDSKIIRPEDEPMPDIIDLPEDDDYDNSDLDDPLLNDSKMLEDKEYFGMVSDANYDSYVSRHL